MADSDIFPARLRYGSGALMDLCPSKLLLAFKEDLSEDPNEALGKVELLLRDTSWVLEQGLKGGRVNHTARKFWVRSRDETAIDADAFSVLRQACGPGLGWIGPVYRLPDIEGDEGLVSPFPNILTVNPTAKADEASLSKTLEQLGLKPAGGYREFVTLNPTEATVYGLQQRLIEEEHDLVQDVRFQIMHLLSSTASVSGPLPEQWNLSKLGPNLAWGQLADPNDTEVVVCILDRGCDLDHPDLKPKLVSPGVTVLREPKDARSNIPHGTNCAGIVVTNGNRLLGVVGNGKVRLLPVRMEDEIDDELSAGIEYAVNYAVTQRVRVVISISWGRLQLLANNEPKIVAAIEKAFSQDVVICAATGNGNAKDKIDYPARLAHVIAVGASDQSDNRWQNGGAGSNFGPELSVVAPGVAIPTTTNGGGYTGFSRTSAATPHVAGLAALLLSKYPLLKVDDVRSIIIESADKVGVDSQVRLLDYNAVLARPGWNEEMGYGRINVARALDAAKRRFGGG